MSEKSLTLTTSIQYIKGVGPRLGQLFQKKGVKTLEDALFFLPRTYEDRKRLSPIGQLRPGKVATVRGRVRNARQIRQGRRNRFEATLYDETGSLQLLWFNAYPSLTKEFSPGNEFLVHGEVRYFGAKAQITHPDFERIVPGDNGKPQTTLNFGRVVPVYSETEGLHQKTIRKILGETLRHVLPTLEDPLPEDMRKRFGFPNLRKSFVSLHFPTELPDPEALSSARKRIIFEEFFVLQLGLGLKKREQQQNRAPVFENAQEVANEFTKHLPFQLTDDQNKTLNEISKDLGKGVPMSRLVQGDVGCGKTVVALTAAAIAAKQGYQTAFMAPTEVLAQQHYKLAKLWFEPMGVVCALAVHGIASDASVKKALRSGHAKLVIGTHALFQNAIQFEKLGLVVVDEQHRFGVEQRNQLIRKGKETVPHLLMMTATPIPRTLALTLHGDLDFSLIRQKPKGRKPIVTTILSTKNRPKLYQKVRATLDKGQQAYIIYPLIEASEKLDLRSATEMYEKLRTEIFPDFQLALVHGKMKGADKDETLQKFKAGEFQLLVSTTVIEVGIDVPNATLMVIEHPERLGLSQLHQLRGRVGRGSASSECILICEKRVTPRLKIMEETEDGFKIAEEDLQLRGPGEFLGTQQHGLPGFRVGHILRDAALLSLARSEAEMVLESDPTLEQGEHAAIRKMVESRWKEKIERLRSG